MRFLAIIGALSLITACNASPLKNPAMQSLNVVFNGFDDAPVTRQSVETLPYATMLAQIGKSGNALVVLTTAEGDKFSWIAADKVVLVTQKGRLVKSVGLIQDRTAQKPLGQEPLLQLAKQPVETLNHRYTLDLRYKNLYAIPVNATLQFEGQETITILERTYQTRRYVEYNRCDILDWDFTNTYWLDVNSGFVWQSVQHLSPDLPPVFMAVTKPVAGR